MNIFLKAFSLEQEPHIIVVTWFSPGGATCYNENNASARHIINISTNFIT
jgi:hypothetical protein